MGQQEGSKVGEQSCLGCYVQGHDGQVLFCIRAKAWTAKYLLSGHISQSGNLPRGAGLKRGMVPEPSLPSATWCPGCPPHTGSPASVDIHILGQVWRSDTW